MPGMWELPALRSAKVPSKDLRMTVRHAIMQVNYYVRIRAVPPGKVRSMTVENGERRWVQLSDLGALPLTGLTRKVLRRAHLLLTQPQPALARRSHSAID